MVQRGSQLWRDSVADSAGNFQSARRIGAVSSSPGVQDFPFFVIIIIIIIIILQEFSSGTLEVHVNENPQLVVQLPPQSTTHKTLGVMIYTKDVSGKLALPQFRRKKDRLTVWFQC